MKTVKHFLIVYSAPIILILLVSQVFLSSSRITQGDILILALVPIFTCGYSWILIASSPYKWLGDFYSKNQKHVESFFGAFSKISLVLSIAVFFFADSILLQNGYQRKEINRMTHLDGSHYYRKSDQALLGPGQGKLKCVEKEVSGKTVSRCYEVP